MADSVHPQDLVAGRREHELAALVALVRAKQPKGPTLVAVLEQLGSAVKLAQIRVEDQFLGPGDPSVEFAGLATPQALAQALEDVGRWSEAGHDMRSVLDDNYPASLRQIFDRPPLVFVRGHWCEDADWRSVAVVGTRAATPDGLRRARKLSRELVAAGYTIISGLAKGIDTAAHRSALEAEGRTVAVMGTGLDHVYPRENNELARQIVEAGGALVSQFFPHQSPTRWTFPMRNAVMSGLSLATVVVEAGATSGAKMQARLALKHGRAVFLLRSLVEEHAWAREYVETGKYGTHAVLVDSTAEIVSRLAAIPADSSLAV